MGAGMSFRERAYKIQCGYVLGALVVATPCLPAQAQDQPLRISPATQVQAKEQVEATAQATDDGFIGPRFRKGLWKFVRTLDIVRNGNTNVKYRLANNEVTRCVDPTDSMKATFSSAPVGSCVSDRPEKVGNKYTFGKRCDYLGAVSTVITVYDDDSYTELNELSGGESPKTDLVTAKRIGDCGDEKADGSARAAVSAVQH
jgi:hypothetical protein